MKCSHPDCRESLEDFDKVLKCGYGYCKSGHRTEVLGDTRFDIECECGAKAVKDPGHSHWCPAYWKRKIPK